MNGTKNVLKRGAKTVQQTAFNSYQGPGAPAGAALVQAEHLTHFIQTPTQKITILNDVSFSIPLQSMFAIIGPSGSGKSTLLNILTGIDRPSSGRIIFAGEEIRAKGENQLARWRGQHVGIVFQFFQLVPTLTALENVLLALELGRNKAPRSSWRAIALHCLEIVDLKGYEKRLPSELSGGQQQRVAIARALANDPPVIIADEPTGNLDSQMAYAIFDILVNLTRRGKTILYVTHDLDLAKKATAGIMLRDGRIVNAFNANAVIAAPPTPMRYSPGAQEQGGLR
ncbi:MAG: ABC transporter ATP-binding protein [Ktedonobacteraceae bacterium]|nr:ABC transporter ATP-binding protein [Ktedonobacteraceae bacterium]